MVWFYAGADRDRRAAHLDDLTPAAALTIMAESLSERGDWTGGSLVDVNDSRRGGDHHGRLIHASSHSDGRLPGIHRDGTWASIQRSVGTGYS
jgi:hypothetical protein